jgi:tetratricopeptide (TPR) repeat protein
MHAQPGPFLSARDVETVHRPTLFFFALRFFGPVLDIELLNPKNRRSKTKQKSRPDGMGASAPIRFSRKREWFFRIFALLLVPLLLAGFEIVLRLSGYGYPSQFFLPAPWDPKGALVENDQFAWRFFPPHLARRPVPFVLPVEKPEKSYRIFILGESAAMGDPDPAFSFGRILQALLEERFPEGKFELINLAFTAINSHVIRSLAWDSARRQADAWVVYMGNNEVTGPFGPGTVFGKTGRALPAIRSSVAFKATKTGQWLQNRIERNSGETPAAWGGLAMFLDHQIQEDDPRLEHVYRNFQGNLQAIIAAARASGAEVIVSTVPANLRDCAPFASSHSIPLSAEQKSAWDAAFLAGTELQSAGIWDQAIPLFLEAAQLDPGYAEIHFRLGQCHAALEDHHQAVRSFARARDLDTLRLRADSRLNEIIRTTALNRDSRTVHFVDAGAVFAGAAPDGSPGREFFFDHVHLTFEGNYLLAREFAEKFLAFLPEAMRGRDQEEWASLEVASQRLGYIPWSEAQLYEAMRRRLQEPPFRNQLDHNSRGGYFQAKLDALAPATRPAALQNAVPIYREALAHSPEDRFLHEHFGRLLAAAGNNPAALEQFQRVNQLLPHYATGHYNTGKILKNLGQFSGAEDQFRQAIEWRPGLMEAHHALARLLADQGKTNQAAAAFQKALRMEPRSVETHLQFGSFLEEQGRFHEAIEQYEQAARLHPDRPMPFFNLAKVYAAQNRRAEAIENLRISARLQPDFWEARFLLGIELLAQEQFAEAEKELRAVTELRPDYVPAQFHLGTILMKQRRFQEAATRFQTALQLDPTHRPAQVRLQELRTSLGEDG